MRLRYISDLDKFQCLIQIYVSPLLPKFDSTTKFMRLTQRPLRVVSQYHR